VGQFGYFKARRQPVQLFAVPTLRVLAQHSHHTVSVKAPKTGVPAVVTAVARPSTHDMSLEQIRVMRLREQHARIEARRQDIKLRKSRLDGTWTLVWRGQVIGGADPGGLSLSEVAAELESTRGLAPRPSSSRKSAGQPVASGSGTPDRGQC
jgi:hypothetical protein